jgi:serine/threonine protein phosphatase Stp1
VGFQPQLLPEPWQKLPLASNFEANSFMTIGLAQYRDSSATHIGLVRSTNQDNYICNATAGIWVVADGMGGHYGGERAAAAIVERISIIGGTTGFDESLSAVRTAIANANQQIFEEAQAEARQMGSTIVALVIRDGRYAILWAGDSRAYLKRGDIFRRLTRDHTQAEELIDAGLLDPNSVTRHPSSHILVRAIGVMPSVELAEVKGESVEGDVFLLCSDGLHNLVSETEMAKTIDSKAFARVSEQLVELGLERGAPDNITICLISVGGNAFSAHISSGNFEQ